MEILIALFLLGLVCALIKVVWEYFVAIIKFFGSLILFPFALVFTYWRSFAWIVSIAIVCCTVYYMFPMVRDSLRESRELKVREAEERKAQEMEQMKREEARRKQIQQEREARRLAEEGRLDNARRVRDREERIRGFAIRENPSLWAGYQELGGSIDEQEQRVESLRQDFIAFNRDPSKHDGYLKACKALETMRAAHEEMRRKIEEAYFEFRSFEALPERGKTRAVSCINEAEDILNRYKTLSQERTDATTITTKTSEGNDHE